MNMRKVSMVSRTHKFEESTAMRCNPYTLCEVVNLESAIINIIYSMH